MRNFIRTSIKKIKQAIDCNKLVIFVGAGVSANSNFPSWSKLVDSFAEELGLPNENNSLEYYLKTPQCYYNERGEKEYNDKIDEVFNKKDVSPNLIHNSIFALKPSCVITTNFDDLLEKTIKANGLFYTIVRQDRDLPYCINDRLVIKMHGDAKLKNIVLKEEDYLSYSRKFPLIENYLKSLFCTKTILFVGYSAEDPDFKMLFQWVKDELKEHFQPAYLLETSKKVNRIDFNYYKNRGINILYYDEIKNDVIEEITNIDESNLSDDRGRNLNRFLRYIEKYKENPNNLIDVAYDKLSPLMSVRAITPDDVMNILDKKCYYDLNADSELLFPECESIHVYINKLKYDGNQKKQERFKEKLLNNEKFKEIMVTFIRAGIEQVTTEKYGEYLDIRNDLNFKLKEEEDSFKDWLLGFEYSKIKEKLKCFLSDKKIEGNEFDFIKKAYLFYTLGYNLEAFNILRDVANESFARKEYLFYFLALFNMKQLKGLLKFDIKLKDNCNSTYDKIQEEIDNINLEQRYMELPEHYKNKIHFISELFGLKCFYKWTYKFETSIRNIVEQKSTIENGGISFTNEIIQVFHSFKNIQNYVSNNYLMVEHYVEIQNLYLSYVECILASYSIDGECGDSTFRFTSKVNCIDKMTLHIIIKYIDTKKLKQLIEKYKIKFIELSEEDKQYLCDVLKNLSLSGDVLTEMRFNNHYQKVINNTLVILTHTTTTNEMLEIISKAFVELVRNSIADMDTYENYLDYIISTFNRDKEVGNSNILLYVMDNYIDMVSKKKANGFDLRQLSNDRFFRNLTLISIEKDKDATLKNDAEISSIIEYVNISVQEDKPDNIVFDMIFNMLLIIYPIIPQNIVNKLQDMIDIVIKIFKEKDEYTYIKLLFHIIKNRLNIENEEMKIDFAIRVNRFIEKDKKQIHLPLGAEESGEVKVSYTVEHTEEVMRYLLHLITSKDIIYDDIKNRVECVSEKFPIFKFITDTENFNTDEFNTEWVLYINDMQLRKVFENSKVKEKIINDLLQAMEKKEIKKPYDNIIRKVLKGLSENNELNNEDLQ